jgi:predicted porin
LQYGQSGRTSVTGNDPKDKAKIWSALYTYSFSKRTMLHARYSVLTNDKQGNSNFYNNAVSNGVATGPDSDYSGLMIGLRHSF